MVRDGCYRTSLQSGMPQTTSVVPYIEEAQRLRRRAFMIRIGTTTMTTRTTPNSTKSKTTITGESFTVGA